jgi:hypothetical protein
MLDFLNFSIILEMFVKKFLFAAGAMGQVAHSERVISPG